MDMRELAEMLAPNTMSQVDQVAGRPSVGGVMGFPMSAVQDVSRPALSLVDSGIGALSQGLRRNPNIGKFLNAANAGFAAAGGDFNQRERSRLLNAQAGMFDARAAGYQSDSRLSDAQAGLMNEFGQGQPGAGGQVAGSGRFEITDARLAQLAAAGYEAMANSLRATRDAIRANAKVEEDKSFLEQAAGMEYEAAQDFLMLRNPALIELYRKAAGLPQAEDVRGEVNARRKSTEVLREVMRNAAQLESMDITEENSGQWQQPIGVIVNKLFAPNSAVLLAEVDAITDGMASELSKSLQAANNFVEAGGSLPVKEVKRLREMGLQVAATAAEYELDMASRWDERATAMGLRAPERARAKVNTALLDRAQEFVDSRKPAENQGVPVAVNSFMDIPSEILQPIIDQVESEMPGLSDQELIREVNRIVKANRLSNTSRILGIRGN